MLRSLMPMTRALVLAGLAPLGGSSAEAPGDVARSPATQERACPCQEGSPPGTIWRSNQPIGLAEIAHLVAPVLWFSRDEPLLKRERTVIPQAHPCDEPSTGPVVYYQVTQIAYNGDEEVSRPEEDDPRFFEKVDQMTLKYFFYYPEDIGLDGHLHDLEAVEFEVALQKPAECYEVRVVTAVGLAHGNRWYSNTLETTSDTKYPLHVFVEEGKHGSAVDRNADGYFTRGYDVNHTINDAWGVRDVLGSGVLLSSAYNPEMTKPRLYQNRVLPPEVELPCVSASNSSLRLDQGHQGRYELRPGNRIPRCPDIPEGRERLYGFMDYQSFGKEEKPEQYESASIESAFRNLKSPESFVSFSLRSEGDLGAALVFRGFDLRQGWIVPKLNINSYSASAGLMYTPSASRVFDWYIAAGIRRQFETTTETVELDTPEGRVKVKAVRPPEWDPQTELGIRIRAEVPPKVRPFVFGYHFAGVRLGVQALGTSRLDDIRLVFEVGAGAW